MTPSTGEPDAGPRSSGETKSVSLVRMEGRPGFSTHVRITENTGTIIWTPAGESANNVVSIAILDSKGSSLPHSFTLSATTSGFYFVSKNGNNSNNGSAASPWATIEQASNTAGNSGYVYVRAGESSATISLSGAKCGRFMAYPGEKVTITGSGTEHTSFVSGTACNRARRISIVRLRQIRYRYRDHFRLFFFI